MTEKIEVNSSENQRIKGGFMQYGWRYFKNKRQQKALNEIKWSFLITVALGIATIILRG